MGVAKAFVGVVGRRVLRKTPFLAFTGLSHNLDTPDLVFSLFSTFEWQLAIAETPRTRNLAIFMTTTTTTMTTQPITLPLCACARNNKRYCIIIIMRFAIAKPQYVLLLTGMCGEKNK